MKFEEAVLKLLDYDDYPEAIHPITLAWVRAKMELPHNEKRAFQAELIIMGGSADWAYQLWDDADNAPVDGWFKRASDAVNRKRGKRNDDD